MMSRIGSKHGFTLIEVMIAVSILAVGIIGILHAYVAAINGFSAGRAGIDAAFLLKEKIGDVEKDMLEKKDMLPGACEGEFGESKNGFRWRLEIKPVDFGVEELKDCLNEATLTVSNGRTNQSRSFSVTTYMESNEPVNEQR
ncbi:MAG: prepilin-type N-terminal cleavage/methylation domain-containing protein [Candidatus Omnitrophica bacterium]|nr:prepilin-type N-terminal cleavage/methylation domain-containing protein [Candidatus Omnitrophota bacterium]